MSASLGEFREAFEGLIGTDGPAEIWWGGEADSYASWMDIFESTGLDFDSSTETIDAFENFLIAFYPQEGMSGDDWASIREEFFGMYDIDDHNIDWQAYREAIGYE